jgi:hypothetical protein
VPEKAEILKIFIKTKERFQKLPQKFFGGQTQQNLSLKLG